MEEWKEVRLDSLVNRKICYGIVQPGFSPKNGIPVIKVNNVVKGLRDVSECDKTTEEISNSYKRTILKGGELIISLVGTVGCVDIAPSSFAGANLVRATGMIDIEDELIKHWVLYYIRTRQGQQYIEENLNTTVQRALNIKDLCKMPIPITSKHYMGRIVSILKSLDDKIEVNRRINDNLEQQAQALFKSWFVDFEPFKDGEFVESELGMIPKGWRVKSLGELITVIDNRGKTPPLCSDTNYPIIDVKSLSGVGRILNYDNCTKYVSHETYHKWFRNGHPQYYDLLLSTVGSLAEIKIFTGGNGCIAQNVVALRNQDLALFLFDYLNYIKSDLISYNIGSVQPSIKVTHIIKHKILVPSNDILNRYTYCCKAITDLIRNNCKTMNTLSTLRDTLLPKLMSGELKVNEVVS